MITVLTDTLLSRKTHSVAKMYIFIYRFACILLLVFALRMILN